MFCLKNQNTETEKTHKLKSDRNMFPIRWALSILSLL